MLLIDANNHTGYAQVVQTRAASSPTRDFVLGDDVFGHVEASGASGGLNQTYLCDGHGSVRGVATLPASGDPAMARSRTYDYDAYGNLRLGQHADFVTPATTDRLGYSGEAIAWLDDTTTPHVREGMQYLRARWYSPDTGTFNRMDPFAGFTHDPQSLHKYAYVHGDPVNGNDPSGHKLSFSETLLTVGLIGMLAGIAINTLNNYALGNDWRDGILRAAVLGLILAPLAVLFPAVAIFLAGVSLPFAAYTVWQVMNDPRSSTGQRVTAWSLLGAALFGSEIVQSGRIPMPRWLRAGLNRTGGTLKNAVQQAFNSVAEANTWFLGFITPKGKVIFVNAKDGDFVGHIGAIEAGLAPSGSKGFRVTTNSQGEVNTLMLSSEINATGGGGSFALPQTMRSEVIAGLPLSDDVNIVVPDF